MHQCPICKSFNNSFNKKLNIQICNYCFLGFEADNSSNSNLYFRKINFDKIQSKINNIENLDISIGIEAKSSKLIINEIDFLDKKIIDEKIYNFINTNKSIKSILLGNINYFNIQFIFKYKKFFNEDINIFVLNPSIDSIYNNKINPLFIYSTFCISKIFSAENMDIFNCQHFDEFNIFTIKYGTLDDSQKLLELENFSNKEIQSNILNPTIHI